MINQTNFNYLDLLDLSEIDVLFHFPNYFFIGLTILLLWIGKYTFQLLKGFPIEIELVKNDNKAVTFSFAGFLLGIAVILETALSGDGENLQYNLFSFLIWGVIGIVLLSISDIWNDKVILYRIHNISEMKDKNNLSVGIATGLSYLSSGIIIRGVISGPSHGLITDIVLTIIYFVAGQLLFSFFAFAYQKLIKYSYQSEILDQNVAAGASLGLNMLAMSLLISAGISYSFSLVYLLAWSITGISIMIFMRLILDKLIIPSEQLDKEIHTDKNWGMALLEGGFSFAGVITLTQIVL